MLAGCGTGNIRLCSMISLRHLTWSRLRLARGCTSAGLQTAERCTREQPWPGGTHRTLQGTSITFPMDRQDRVRTAYLPVLARCGNMATPTALPYHVQGQGSLPAFTDLPQTTLHSRLNTSVPWTAGTCYSEVLLIRKHEQEELRPCSIS